MTSRFCFTKNRQGARLSDPRVQATVSKRTVLITGNNPDRLLPLSDADGAHVEGVVQLLC
jgi:hypothetical protein